MTEKRVGLEMRRDLFGLRFITPLVGLRQTEERSSLEFANNITRHAGKGKNGKTEVPLLGKSGTKRVSVTQTKGKKK